MVVVASQAGRPRHPLWFRNIEADPEVTVQIKGDRRAMRARTRRRQSAPSCGSVDLYSDYDSYQSWTDREIPVVIIEPR